MGDAPKVKGYDEVVESKWFTEDAWGVVLKSNSGISAFSDYSQWAADREFIVAMSLLVASLKEELSSARAELTEVLEENHELDVDRARRRSQAKRYQKSAGRRHRKMEALESDLTALLDAAEELLEVADHRGDNVLPHPADDTLLWTARMQTAWDEIAEVVTRVRGKG